MRKVIKRFATFLVSLLLLTVGATWWALNGSLASIDGELTLSGLSAPVSLQRDHNGVLSIQAGNEADAMRAPGFVHAQERFFEMDLMLRSAAGERSALFGPVALGSEGSRGGKECVRSGRARGSACT